jgi:hypothetical protein
VVLSSKKLVRAKRPQFIDARGVICARKINNEDLGIDTSSVAAPESKSQAKLHAKDVSVLDADAFGGLQYTNDEVRVRALDCLQYLKDVKRWLPDRLKAMILVPIQQLPKGKFEKGDVDIMRRVKKLRKYFGKYAGAVRGFWVFEPAKFRRRPIFAPMLNDLRLKCEHEVRYRNRREVHEAAMCCECDATVHSHDGDSCETYSFDMQGWYDQFGLQLQVQALFCFRADGQTYSLTRLPMGARPSCAIAQYATWALINGTACQNERVKLTTMIDNVRIHAPAALARQAAIEFLQRCAMVGAQVNEVNVNDVWNDITIQKLRVTEEDFLGEHYVYADAHGGPTVALSTKTRDRLAASINRIHEWTARNMAAHVGLLLWATPTTAVSPACFFGAMRSYRRVAAVMATNEQLWDFQIPTLSLSEGDEWRRWTKQVLAAEPLHISSSATTHRCTLRGRRASRAVTT